MATARRPLGFGNIQQTAEFFGLPPAEVRKLAAAGTWPSWVIGGRRVFDLDLLVEKLAHEARDREATTV